MHAPEGATPDLAGRIIGRQFRLESPLGRGGMGDVYLAEQLELGRRVVIKLLNWRDWSTPEREERFRREARVLAQLNHPNVVQLYTAGRSEDGLAYLAMEYIEGRTLSSFIADTGAMGETQVLAVLEQIASALVEAHAHGIVHRDLKPDNVMLTNRYGQAAFVKVLDFGIAKLMHGNEARLTQAGSILGTPQYMAPEQLRELAVDGRTDIYAVGLIGYELLTGKVPFEGENTMDLMVRVLSDEAVPPSRKTDGVRISPATEALIVRCLAKDPADRFQSSTELREALVAIPRADAKPAQLQPQPSSPPAAAAPTDRPVLAIHEDDLHVTRTTYAPRSRALALAALAAVLPLLMAVGLVAYSLDLFQVGPVAAPEPPRAGEMLEVREWVQGIPFPAGTEYNAFEPKFIDARVAADREHVIAFYRYHVAKKWGGFRDLGGGLIPQDPNAPIKSLTVTPAGDGSRIFIARRER